MNWKRFGKAIGLTVLSSFLVYFWVSLLEGNFLNKLGIYNAVSYGIGLLVGMHLWASWFVEKREEKT